MLWFKRRTLTIRRFYIDFISYLGLKRKRFTLHGRTQKHLQAATAMAMTVGKSEVAIEAETRNATVTAVERFPVPASSLTISRHRRGSHTAEVDQRQQISVVRDLPFSSVF